MFHLRFVTVAMIAQVCAMINLPETEKFTLLFLFSVLAAAKTEC